MPIHRGESDCNGTLKMYSTGNTSTLADMWVECSCGAKRSMSGATQRDNFDGVACPGHHPFRPNVKNHKCNKPLIPSQRGASNVYFAVSRSAISIPPWINPLYNLIDEHLRDIELAKQLTLVIKWQAFCYTQEVPIRKVHLADWLNSAISIR